MSTPVRTQDMAHFAIVRDSLARDGLHVAMAAHDRRRLQDYAGALARTLAGQAGLRVEAYHPSRLESVVVDLMLHRFDAALSDISRPGTSGGHGLGFHPAASRPGCVLFVPDAHALPRAEFRQLLRIAAGTRRNGLRLVALFDADSPVSNERIADMGAQVARWDLDEETDADIDRASAMWHRGSHVGAAQSGLASPRSLAGNGHRWLAAACAAAMLALLPAMLPTSSDGSMLSPAAERTVANTVTRSGIVELAGEPRQDYAHAPASDDARLAERGMLHGTLNDAQHDALQGALQDAADIELQDKAAFNAPAAARSSTTEAGSR